MKSSPLGIAFFLLLFSGITRASIDPALFPLPSSLEDNVEFWRLIYTEISLTEGVLHDRDYPLVIYDTINVKGLLERDLNSHLNKQRKEIARLLKNIESRPDISLSMRERRIKRLFEIHAPEHFKGAQKRIRFQLGQRERFLEGIRRSGALMDTIHSIFKELEIPSLLAFLPHVESSFNYDAYSKVGAAGLWQFMPATGRQFLRIDSHIDERRDPILSTRAAGLYLKWAYEQLGSWPLALSAYNHGVAGITRAVESVGSTDLGVIANEYESPSFQFASKNFYSCFIAACQIALRPEAYFDTVSFDSRKNYYDLLLNYNMNTEQISRILGISKKSIMEHNPAILPEVYELNLPIPAGYSLRIDLSRISPKQVAAAAMNAPDSLWKREQHNSKGHYVVARGETLSSIAVKTGQSVEIIKSLNGMRNSFIRAGDVLKVSFMDEPEENKMIQVDYSKILRIGGINSKDG
ncbi:MAG: transglycosylase SLT domain-containing protein [Fibrobacterota bacterium]